MATAGLGDLSALHQQSADWKQILSVVSTMKIELLPLHCRPEDIAPTVAAVLEEIQSAKSTRDRKHLSPTALRTLEGYAWPSEMREVIHNLQSAIQKSPNDVIEIEHLSLAIRTFASHVLKPEPPREIQLERLLEDYERKIIVRCDQAFSTQSSRRRSASWHIADQATTTNFRLED